MQTIERELPIEFDPALIRKLDRNGPRYTSYPTADRFVEAFDAEAYKQCAGRRAVGALHRPLSLYVHLPFCDTLCYFCACNKIITKDHQRSARYVDYLKRELALQVELFGADPELVQMHWGGGTPTFLSESEMRDLMAAIRSRFQLAPDTRGEYSIEIDPRKADAATIAMLRDLGFNRLSFGVQDFDPDVQRAVNRWQPEAQTVAVIDAARRAHFHSISVDLIYGLPRQTVVSFDNTLSKIIALSPDRIALYNYAHLPTIFKPQRRINEADLPAPDAKLEILRLAIAKFSEAGYVYIGMDHFAKPDDELAVAQRQGRLHRNFQGYSTHAECDLIALGVSAIGKLPGAYSQNVRTLDDYYDRLDRGMLPVMRGLELMSDDLIRWTIIQALMCHFELAKESIETAYLIDFDRYFARELAELEIFVDDGLLELDDSISVTRKGRLFVRNICMVFDRYLRADRERERYSKVI
jgi:oxygen-independent coproporphyrinogen-3 oxidase